MSKPKLSKREIKKLYNDLFDESIYSSQQRGFEFEKLIEAVLENESLEPRASYKPKGEQVDGSFFWSGQTFLLEAKWVKSKLPASSIYAFKGKLDGKFHTSSGVFLAVNGYSDDVEDALKFGKSLNILLFDTNDISMIFNGGVTFLEVLKFKLREAGDTGSLNVTYRLKSKVENISKSEDIRYFSLATFNKKYSKQTKSEDILIFVEGRSDVTAIEKLLKPIEAGNLLSYKIVVLESVNNIRQLPSLLNLYATYHQTKGVIVILDDDQETVRMKSIIEGVVEQLENSSIPVQTKFFFKKYQLYDELKSFIENIAADYYDPEIDIPKDTLRRAMETADWDFDKKEIRFPDDTGIDITIQNLEDLIQHLNEEVVSEMDGNMPLYWLKEKDYLDYAIEAREYLIDCHKDKIEKIGWDSDDL